MRFLHPCSAQSTRRAFGTSAQTPTSVHIIDTTLNTNFSFKTVDTRDYFALTTAAMTEFHNEMPIDPLRRAGPPDPDIPIPVDPPDTFSE